MRLWLRVWGVIFGLGAADFLLLPSLTVHNLDAVGDALGFHAHVAPVGFWVPLAAAYMVLIAFFCFEEQVRYLVIAKVASSLFALGYFVALGFPFAFLAAGVIDAAIAAGTVFLWQRGRPAGRVAPTEG